MTNSLRSQFQKSTKAAAIKTAKQMAREPLEVLRKTPDQILGTETMSKPKSEKKPHGDKQKKVEEEKKVEEISREKSRRLTTAYSTELRDISREKLFKELSKKISEGEVINLVEYSELSIEQKEVLKAQMEAVDKWRVENKKEELMEHNTKPKRNLFAGAKTQLERMKRKSEIRMPPSG